MKKYAAEFIGTFVLLFIGTGAIVLDLFTGGGVGNFLISLAFGASVWAMIFIFGSVSGAHINPAVTIGFWFSGRFEGRDVLPYIIAQISGALLASFLVLQLFPGQIHYGMTLPNVNLTQTILIEIVITFILMYVIMNVSTNPVRIFLKPEVSIGGIVFFTALICGPLTGASMNPARSIAPAVVSGDLSLLWIYIAAPIVGACFSIFGCRFTKEPDCCPIPTVCGPIQISRKN